MCVPWWSCPCRFDPARTPPDVIRWKNLRQTALALRRSPIAGFLLAAYLFFPSQISIAHIVIDAHFVGRTSKDGLAIHKHSDAIGQREDNRSEERRVGKEV